VDKIDKMIEEIVNKKISEPIKYENTIKNALKNKENKIIKSNIIEKVAVFVLGVTMIGGVVFAKQITNIINEFTKQNINYIASDDEYIQNLNMEYNTKDNLSIKIDSICVDDFKIQLNFNYLYDKPITSAESKIVIKDENNNLIFKIDDFELVNYYEYIFKKEDRQKYGDTVTNGKTIVNNIDNKDEIQQTQLTIKHESSYQNITKNNLKRNLELFTDIDSEKFPKSKKIYILLEDVVLKNGSNIVKEIKEKWEFEVILNEKILKRKNEIYTQKEQNISNKEFRVIKAESSNTQFMIKIYYSGEDDLHKVINIADLGEIQIYDVHNNRYVNAQAIEILNNNVIKVNYNIDKNTLLDKVLIRIKNFNEIELIKK